MPDLPPIAPPPPEDAEMNAAPDLDAEIEERDDNSDSDNSEGSEEDSGSAGSGGTEDPASADDNDATR